MKGKLRREIEPPVVVKPPAVVHARTCLKGLSAHDTAVLCAVGAHLGILANRDLAQRCALGNSHNSDDWAHRKQRLTTECSSRWAGAITRANNAAYETAVRNRKRNIVDTRRAMVTIERRAREPTRDEVPGRHEKSKGYTTKDERHHKLLRLQRLRGRLSRLQRESVLGKVSVCRGGKRLLKKRLHLEEANLTGEAWRKLWEAARSFLYADGESCKPFGNETIRVYPDGTVELKLPRPLAHLSNAAHGRYRLEGSATFSYHAEEWLAQVSGDRAVAYRIWHEPQRGRWYVDAAFTPAEMPQAPALEEAIRHGAVGVDLNSGHLACWQLDESGNPVGVPKEIPLDLEGSPGATRDGRLRAAISELLRYARSRGVRAIAVEDLGFDEARATGRETMGRGRGGKRFRRAVCGIPTHRFKKRLVAMAGRMGVAVVATDPAYTSKWGAEHWQKPLSCERHEAAAVVIARRGLGHGARRKVRGQGAASHRRMEAVVGSPAADAESRPDRRARRVRGKEGARTPPRGAPAALIKGVRPVAANGAERAPREPRTVRGSPLDETPSAEPWRGWAHFQER